MKCVENQIPIIRKHKELRDISNFIQKSETGPQMIFGIQSIEKMVKKDAKRTKIQLKEVHDLKKKEVVLVDYKKRKIRLINKVVESNIVKDRLITSLEQNRKIDSLIYYSDAHLGPQRVQRKSKWAVE